MRGAIGVLVLGVLLGALCGGAPGQILKWGQYPAMEHGYDWLSQATIDQVPWAIVADDFYCEKGYPIIAIRWWGSLVAEWPDQPDHFMIGFWTDLAGAEPSQPDVLIYQHKCYDYEYQFIGYDKEMEPVFEYWQGIPWFHQEANTVYWLSIIAVYDLPEGQPAWGWHESFDHWRDDAVQWSPLIYGDDLWHELINPQTGESADMAFELWAVPEPGAVTALAGLVLGVAGIACRSRRRA